jgi:hypothetical protein
MKRIVYLLILVLCCLSLLAKDRNWQDAIFLGAASSRDGAIAMPIGTAIVAAPLTSQHFWFRANGLDYCLNFPSRLSGRVPNLTVNGHTKIAIEGRRVHVLDDDGKDWKLTIISKVAPKEQNPTH